MKEHLWGKTYVIDEEMENIHSLLKAAVEYQQTVKGFMFPYSYWMDKQGKLYIKWKVYDNSDMRVCRYWFDKQNKLITELIPINLKNQEKLRGKKCNDPVVLITGDTHRDFKRVIQFCNKYQTTKEDILIILGDVGINYYMDKRDRFLKDNLSRLPITLFCIRGNHEARPENVGTYKEILWHSGTVYVEEGYPNLIFAKDGEIYNIKGKQTLVMGGAYSVDKWYRLTNKWTWFEDEMMTEAEFLKIKQKLETLDWKMDVILSHTVPLHYQPTDRFLPLEEGLQINEDMELWFQELEKILTYEKWYAGHYHCDRKVDKVQLMFRNVELFCKDTDLKFSME